MDGAEELTNEELTNEELLKQANIAISKVMLGGQSYQIGSRQLTRADLGMLRKLKSELTSAVNGDSGNLLDSTYIAMFDGR